ncbi:DUF4382 domain-containing protein [Sunxiuqinia sp. A32]|uniref:DUF4382 domain-containing protein n=1 Tax=Sunxiuqinia sp. A32 TaxID=3461496 RepID=UPI00404604A4
MMRKIGFLLGVFVVGIFVLISCSEDNSVSSLEGKGTVNIYLTDAPFPVDLVSKTMVTIDKVEIRKQATDSTEASFIVLSEEEAEIDLLMLSNGITENLASAELDAGMYDMIRLHVVNSKVVLTDDTEFDLKIPSGSSSGLKVKIEPAIELTEGQTADVLLDFDVSKSFVVKGNWKGGNINGFNFKPVVRGVLMGMTGRIEGMVTDTTETVLENASVKVWLPGEAEMEDSLVTSSFTDVDGKYKVIGLLGGTYFLTTELEGFINDTVWNVDVTEGSSTMVDIELTPVEEVADAPAEEGGE